MSYALLLTPLVGALIGWFTNYLAVKMIFRPQKPVKIPIIRYNLQGLIPKRKEEIAKTLGEIIERELISWDELAGEIINGEAGEHLVVLLASQAKEAVIKSLPSLTPEPLRGIAGNLVESIIIKQTPRLVEQFAIQSIDELKKHLSLAQLIEDKINGMDWNELEALVLEVASRELKHIEVLGGVIGFFIGLSQLLLGYFFG